jgi:hypothetical protein
MNSLTAELQILRPTISFINTIIGSEPLNSSSMAVGVAQYTKFNFHLVALNLV